MFKKANVYLCSLLVIGNGSEEEAGEATVTVPQDGSAPDPAHLSAHAIVENPRAFLGLFLSYWGDPKRLPDLSEGRSIDVKKLGFWKNVKCTASLKAHKNLPGLCAKWLHIALDFAIAQNQWPVIFTRGDTTYDMTVTFVHCVWACYCAQMNGSPALDVKSTHKVLVYLMGNVKAIVKSWRRRQYFYASASVFRTVGAELKLWLQPQRDGVLDEAERKKRVKALFRVTDYDGMYKMVGDALVSFIAEKTAPFPGAIASQESFQFVAAWKRGLLYINLVRHVTEIPANNHWFKYGYPHFKENKKMMATYCANDSNILKSSIKFQALPERIVLNTPTKTIRKKRTRDMFELSSPEAIGVARRKIICILSSDSDTDEEHQL